MSQSRNNENDSGGSARSSNEIDRMIRQGRSFSGHERNCCFLNTMGSAAADGRFANVSAISCLDLPDDGRALVFVDWDQDGDLDCFISNRNEPRIRFFRNDLPDTHGFLQLDLQGNGADCNRDAIGARVVLELEPTGSDGQPVQLIRTLRAGEGFLSQSSRWLHFGLGKNARIRRLLVQWPGATGETETFTGLETNQRYRIVQGSGSAVSVKSEPRAIAITPGSVELPEASNTHRIPMIYQLAAPEIDFVEFDGDSSAYNLRAGRATLINLWSTTCRPCLAELSEFSDRYDELQQAGVDIVALSIDQLQSGEPDSVDSAKELVDRLKMPFTTGMASAKLVDDLRRLHNTLIKLERPLPLPTSFLIDRDGRLDVIYKGPVNVETLLADGQPQSGDLLDRYTRAAAFPGNTINHPVINARMVNNEATVYFKFARELASIGRTKAAIEAYERVLDKAPETPTALNDLGILYLQLQNAAKAEQYLRQAVALDSNLVEMRINLARALIAQNKLPQAQSELAAAVDSHPRNADAHFNLALLKSRMNDFQGAERGYRKAIDCDPRHGRAHFSLANLLERQKDLDGAKRHYQQAHEIDPGEPIILLSLGRIHFRAQDYDQAREKFQAAVELRPDFAEAHYQLGVALMQLRQTAAAKSEFETTLQLDTSHRRARSALEQLLRSSR